MTATISCGSQTQFHFIAFIDKNTQGLPLCNLFIQFILQSE